MPDACRDPALEQWFGETTDWSDSILPSYSGGGIGNLVGTILQSFGCHEGDDAASLLPPVSPSILDDSYTSDARVVVLIVLDGYGSHIAADGIALRERAPHGLVAASTLTSVFPSTTAAALTTLQTGVAPGRHGLAGYTLFVPEARRIMNMIQFTAVDGSTLPARVADPAAFLPVPTIYQRLAACGIESVVVSHQEFARSALTVLHSGDTPYCGHRTAAEFALMLRRETSKPGRRFVFGYWAGVDMLGHSYGPASDEVALEARVVEHALIEGFLRPMAAGSHDVTVFLSADHGLASLREQDAEMIGSLSKTAGKFRSPPAGERRAAGLFTSGADQRALLADAVADRGVVLDANAAANAGLFGPAPRHPQLLERIGDTLLVARGSHSFPYRPVGESGTFSLGAHGSLSPQEMFVPLLVWRYGR